MVHALNKGKAGEREFCKWLEDNLSIITSRNLDQAREGGADVTTDDFLFEVKRRETLDLQSWWNQVVKAGTQPRNSHLIPVVCYRQNRKQWQFLISAKFIGLEKGFIHLEERVFRQWASEIVKGLASNSPLDV
jgi:hypothetical protein